MSSKRSSNETDRSPSPSAKKLKIEKSFDSNNEGNSAQVQTQQLSEIFDPDQKTPCLDDFLALKSYLKKLQDEHSGIAELFETWCTQRKKTIDELDNLQQKISDLDFYGKVISFSTLVSKVIGFICGSTRITEFIEEKTNEHLSTVLIKGGDLVETASKVTRYAFSNAYEKKVEEVLEKDKKLTESLRNSIHFSHEGSSLLDRLFQCKIPSPILPKVIQICGDYIKLHPLSGQSVDVQKFLENIRQGEIEGLHGITNEVANSLEIFHGNPELRQQLEKIYEIFEESPYIFESLESGSEYYRQFDELNHSGFLSLCIGITPGTLSVVKPRNVFDGINVLIDILSVAVIVFDLVEKNRYSDTLQRIKCALQSELEIITKKLKK